MTNASEVELVFHVFDRLTFSEWRAQKSTVPLDERLTLLCDEIDMMNRGIEQPCVVFVQGSTVHNETDLLSWFQRSMDQGFEGIMLKDLAAPYEWDRTKSVQKVKPVVTYEGVVTGWYVGRPGTKRANQFAGFVTTLPNGVDTRVGGGFSDALKTQIQTEGPDTWLGRVIEIKAQPDPLTGDGLTKDGKARFPVYVRVRNENDVDPNVVMVGRQKLQSQ